MGLPDALIGYTHHHVVMANPLWHAAKRRNADGDKDAVMLLGDVFLNFSELLLKKGTGGLMNVPIIISRIALSQQVDGEARNVEIVSKYPAAMYTSGVGSALKVKTIRMVQDYTQLHQNYPYTTPTNTIILRSTHNAHKDLETMSENINSQRMLCSKLYSVKDTPVVAALFRNHLLRDVRGNTRKSYKQNFRCTKWSPTEHLVKEAAEPFIITP